MEAPAHAAVLPVGGAVGGRVGAALLRAGAGAARAGRAGAGAAPAPGRAGHRPAQREVALEQARAVTALQGTVLQL